MTNDDMARYEAQFAALAEEVDAFIEEKHDNETRWSWVASSRILLTPVLGILTAVLVLAEVPKGVGAVSAVVTGLSSLATGMFPDDRKRTGNKVLQAKARNLQQRIRDREEERQLDGVTPYQLLRRFRYELSVLQATSSSVAAVQPFWDVPPMGPTV